jgi:hypothetical protein
MGKSMQIKINDDRVRRNVALFLHILSLFSEFQQKKLLHKRVYKAYLNRINGEILFTDLLPRPSQLKEKEWKKIMLSCSSKRGEVVFELLEAGDNQGCFHREELAPLACQIVSQTVQVLNRCVKLIDQNASPDQQLDGLR